MSIKQNNNLKTDIVKTSQQFQFIQKFSDHLVNLMVANFSLFKLTAPHLISFNPQNPRRYINFDNLYDHHVYQIMNDRDPYFIKWFKKLSKDPEFHGFYSNYQIIQRDVEVSATAALNEEIFDIYLKMTKVDHLQRKTTISNVIHKMISLIHEAASISSKNFDLLNINLDIMKFNTLQTIDLSSKNTDLKKTLKYADLLTYLVHKHSWLLVSNPTKLSTNLLKAFNPLYDEISTSCELWCHSSILKSPISIASLSFGLNHESFIAQNSKSNPLYQQGYELSENCGEYLHLKLHLSKILLLLLNLKDIHDVIPSPSEYKGGLM